MMRAALQRRWFDWEQQVEAAVLEYIENDTTGHDLWHSLRVRANIIKLMDERVHDFEVLSAAAYLHDIGRPGELRGGKPHIEMALRVVPEVLSKCGYPEDKIAQVLRCVKYHEHYSFLGHGEPVEFNNDILLFQDADRLDAIGAMGVARVFLFAGAHGLKIWDGNTRFEEWNNKSFSKTAISHIHKKLLQLSDNMNTESGRKEARRRHAILVEFCKEFYLEWGFDAHQVEVLIGE